MTDLNEGVRLQKVLADAGIGSRRHCEELIKEGKVTVDGKVVAWFGAKVEPENVVIHVEGRRVETRFHVGRLDTDTEGLILLTNDGELAHRLTHPSYGVTKTYLAEIHGPIPRDLGRRLRAGINLDDGPAKADGFRIVEQSGKRILVEVVLHEGRTHIVRRLLKAAGHPVRQLARTEFGPVKLGRLKTGGVRTLTLREVGELYKAVGL